MRATLGPVRSPALTAASPTIGGAAFREDLAARRQRRRLPRHRKRNGRSRPREHPSAGGRRYSRRAEQRDSRLRNADRPTSRIRGHNPHPFNLVHLNADNMGAFAARRGPRIPDRYTIGYWFWELSVFATNGSPFSDTSTRCGRRAHFMREALAARYRFRRAHATANRGAPTSGTWMCPFPHSGRPRSSSTCSTCRARQSAKTRSRRSRRSAAAGSHGRRGARARNFPPTRIQYDREGVRRLHQAAAGLNVVLLDGYMDRA